MDFTEYNKEINKRLNEWIKSNKTWISWSITIILLGHILLFGFYYFIGGKDYAIQSFSQILPEILLVDFLGGIGTYAYVAYKKIPSEIYYEQKRIIDAYLPEQLPLSIEHVPTNTLTVDGKDIKAAALQIKNFGSKKIVELQAILNFEHLYYSLEEGGIKERVSVSGNAFNALIFWNDDKKLEKEIELRPDIMKILVVCELTKGKTKEGDTVDLAFMCSDPVQYGIDFAKESIFYIKIMFQGKLEGEYIFRTFYYEDTIYAKPEEQLISFFKLESPFSDIPPKLLSEARRLMKYYQFEKAIIESYKQGKPLPKFRI